MERVICCHQDHLRIISRDAEMHRSVIHVHVWSRWLNLDPSLRRGVTFYTRHFKLHISYYSHKNLELGTVRA